MPFKRYVEIRRVAMINYGKEYGRLVVIVDVVDQNREKKFINTIFRHRLALASLMSFCNSE